MERGITDDPTYVIKHMGRLVHDEKGYGRFAGSTTGVHFVLKVEQECQKVLNLSGGFPESCYRAFLVESPPDRGLLGTTSFDDHDMIRQYLTYPAAHYHQQADMFMQKWEPFCPVLVRKQLLADIQDLTDALYDPEGHSTLDYSTTLIVLMILNIQESFPTSPAQPSGQSPDCIERLSLAHALIDKVVSQGNIRSLQALALFALFNQLSGHCLTLTTINGMMVRLSQSLGLHRHARRFKMGVGEIELRKRLWWWVYVFDRFTSVLHGIPPLINDVDVDNDLPIDCHLHDLEATELSHPLPGERTGVFLFLQYVSLGKKLSRILNLLYTTTQRRDGARKITELDRDLRVWNQNLKAHGIVFDIGDSGLQHSTGNTGRPYQSATLWLQLMSNMTMNLIHRPGLSFDDTSPEFGICLRACLNSGTAVLSLVESLQIPRWLRNLSLVGPATIFQSSLVHIYSHLKLGMSEPDGLPSPDTSMSEISKAISLLKADVQSSVINQAPGNFYCQSLNEIIETLQSLISSLPMVAQGFLDTELVVNEDAPTTDTFDEQAWGGNALDALNYMTASDWMGNASNSFMDFMDLGGS
ncbi:unnamed protein product [Penicillium salamii]|uniref:Xylanolytic transcriptional activator regulatory domain-containing protein n=1 Tax=Penicillium salamii TaxID=1612424 RepID=A0A9W4NSH9_9EURO|nr:unnamed protein product [Penicillium salamii]